VSEVAGRALIDTAGPPSRVVAWSLEVMD
jgi:hypothetical protein